MVGRWQLAISWAAAVCNGSAGFKKNLLPERLVAGWMLVLVHEVAQRRSQNAVDLGAADKEKGVNVRLFDKAYGKLVAQVHIPRFFFTRTARTFHGVQVYIRVRRPKRE